MHKADRGNAKRGWLEPKIEPAGAVAWAMILSGKEPAQQVSDRQRCSCLVYQTSVPVSGSLDLRLYELTLFFSSQKKTRSLIQVSDSQCHGRDRGFPKCQQPVDVVGRIPENPAAQFFLFDCFSDR